MTHPLQEARTTRSGRSGRTSLLGSQTSRLGALLCTLACTLLGGCGSPTSLTIHNGSATAVRIEGLPGGSVTVEPGQLHRAEGIRESLSLHALAANGTDVEGVDLPLPKPGGESVWAIGGKICIVEADYDLYYTAAASQPASVQVLGILREGQHTFTSQGAIAAGPGQRLPRSKKGGAVRALVRMPCPATVSEPITRGWLEMTLSELQPQAPSDLGPDQDPG